MFGKVQTIPQSEKTPFYPEVLTVLQKFTHTGLQLITERPIIFLLAMEFYLIMKVQLEVKLL